MSDEAPAGFEEPLLETRQGPVLDGHGENEPAKEIAEVVGDHPEEQPHLIGPEPVTGEAAAAEWAGARAGTGGGPGRGGLGAGRSCRRPPACACGRARAAAISPPGGGGVRRGVR